MTVVYHALDGTVSTHYMDTKYRRKVIFGKLRKEIGQIIRQLCKYKDIE